jgi:hypothetical protein
VAVFGKFERVLISKSVNLSPKGVDLSVFGGIKGCF